MAHTWFPFHFETPCLLCWADPLKFQNQKTFNMTSVPIAFQLRIRDSSLTALLHLFGQKITYPYRVWWLTPGSHFTLKHPACCVHVWQKRAMVKACNANSKDLYQVQLNECETVPYFFQFYKPKLDIRFFVDFCVFTSFCMMWSGILLP